MIVVLKEKQSDKLQFRDTLGYFPESIARKNYMQMYHFHHDYHVIEDQSMGGWFSVKIKINWSNPLKSFSDFVSRTVKDIAKLPERAMVVVKNIGKVTEDVYDAAKKIAMDALPPELRPLVGQSLLVLEKVVTNPGPTVVAITESAGQIASNIVRETGNAGEVVYREVAKPAFNIVRNVANEAVWKPIHKAVDITVLPLLPKDVRDKLDKVLDFPSDAFAGKLKDKDVLESLKAAGQIGLIPTKIGLNLANDTINTLKKDAVLGPFLEKLDTYSGGLLSSAQSLAKMPDDIYNDRNIDWKARMIDALKIYLTYAAASSLASYGKNLAFTATGQETGLANTPLGRTALAVGFAYGSAYASGSLSNLAGDEFSKESQKLITAEAQKAALAETKREIAKEAVKKGWIDDQKTASLILSAGGRYYGSVTDGGKSYLEAMSEVHDKEFQDIVERQIKLRTGLDVKYWQLVDVYNTDFGRIADDLNRAMARMVPTVGTTDGDFLSNMGRNFVDEMRRIPQNFNNIGANVLSELERTPENLARFAHAVAQEADRTPSNVAQIAENIARESARGAVNVVTEITQAPSNIVDAVSNISTPSVSLPSVSISTPSISLPSVSLPSVSVSAPNIEDLIKKYGQDFVNLLLQLYGPQYPQMNFTPEMLSDLELQYNEIKFGTKKPTSPVPLIAGILAVLAVGYAASQD